MNTHFLRGLFAATPLALSHAAPLEFEAPVRMMAGDQPVKVQSPGYAAPCWADVTGDGKKDLLVGQFSKGKIQVFPGKGDGSISQGDWLKVDGKVAEIPGVW
ncbi:MAG: hypothetical protein ACSHYF_10360 [Verrucomicrobiaceae bacterium]